MEQYYWELPYPTIRLMAYDATRVIYLSEEEAKKAKTVKTAQRIDDPMQLMTDMGVPVFNTNKNE